MSRNEEFLKRAEMLMPELRHKRVCPEGGAGGRSLRAGDRVCFDFGDHYVGYVTVSFSHAGAHPDAPAWVRFRFAEREWELEEDAGEYRGWISRGWIQQEEIHIDVLPARVSLPRRYAFRYLMIEVLDVSPKYALTVEAVEADTVTSADDGALAPYICQDEGLERIYAVACRTLRECMQRVFEDGPKRDRRLWMGDLRLQALANYETYGSFDMVKSCLYLMAGDTLPDGAVAACLFLEPRIEADDTKMFDYSLFFTAALRDYLNAARDTAAARELWPTAKRQIELAESSFDHLGIVRDSDRMGWCFVDWNLRLNKQASAQGIYLYCLKAAIELAKALGETEDAQRFREEYREKRAAALKYLRDDRGYFVSGGERQLSVASQVWMVLGGAAEGREAAELLAKVQAEPEAERMVTPYMYHHYVDALISCGERERALEVLRSYWGGMVAAGADTFWELWDPEDPGHSPYGGTIVNSYCHAWSCAPAYFLQKYFSPGREWINA